MITGKEWAVSTNTGIWLFDDNFYFRRWVTAMALGEDANPRHFGARQVARYVNAENWTPEVATLYLKGEP